MTDSLCMLWKVEAVHTHAQMNRHACMHAYVHAYIYFLFTINSQEIIIMLLLTKIFSIFTSTQIEGYKPGKYFTHTQNFELLI